MPSTNDWHHISLECDAIEHFTSHGYTVTSLEYHQNENAIGLKNVDVRGAHLIRTRADRVAYKDGQVVRFDTKTSSWRKGQQFAIEAVPYLGACIENIYFGLNHLFICKRRLFTPDVEQFGIWANHDALLLFDKICVPEWRRGDSDWMEWARVIKDKLGLSCSVRGVVGARGSGDVYLTINVPKDPDHWKVMIDDFESTRTAT